MLRSYVAALLLRVAAVMAIDPVSELKLPCIQLADFMLVAGKFLRKPRDGHEQWEEWMGIWRAYLSTVKHDAAMTFAVYALRERALLLGLPLNSVLRADGWQPHSGPCEIRSPAQVA